MTIKLSVDVRNARVDAIETIIGTGATLEIRSGTVPANCAAADGGTLLAAITLPADWLTTASGGAKAKNGTWTDSSADASGTATYFRIKDGSTCHLQGTVSATGGGGDMIVDSVTFTAGQSFVVTAFNLTDNNA